MCLYTISQARSRGALQAAPLSAEIVTYARRSRSRTTGRRRQHQHTGSIHASRPFGALSRFADWSSSERLIAPCYRHCEMSAGIPPESAIHGAHERWRPRAPIASDSTAADPPCLAPSLRPGHGLHGNHSLDAIALSGGQFGLRPNYETRKLPVHLTGTTPSHAGSRQRPQASAKAARRRSDTCGRYIPVSARCDLCLAIPRFRATA